MREDNFKGTEFVDRMIIADPHDRSRATEFTFWDGSVTISRLVLDGAAEKRETGAIDIPFEALDCVLQVIRAQFLRPTVGV